MASLTGTGGRSAPIQSLQILRAVAALAVLALHVSNESVTRLDAASPVPSLGLGAAGVDLFFVISGFVIVHASIPLAGRARGSIRFLERRLARIVPLYWAATAAAILCYVALKYEGSIAQLSAGTIVSSLLFIPYQRPDGQMLPVHILGWTLNYEMFFYAVFAVALMARMRTAVLAVTALFVSLSLANAWLGPFPMPVAFWCDPIILEFCFGTLIALGFAEGWRLPRPAATGLLVVGMLGFAVSLHPALADLPRTAKWGLPAAATVAAFVLGGLWRNPGRIGRPLVLLGDASYALYLVHFLVILVLSSAAVWLRIDLAPWCWPYIAALAAASIAAALVVHHAFERPVLRALLGRSVRTERPPAGADSVRPGAIEIPPLPAGRIRPGV
jgi:peptidoglycan/LPS O-acetylase OafA/YrhL